MRLKLGLEILGNIAYSHGLTTYCSQEIKRRG